MLRRIAVQSIPSLRVWAKYPINKCFITTHTNNIYFLQEDVIHVKCRRNNSIVGNCKPWQMFANVDKVILKKNGNIKLIFLWSYEGMVNGQP